MAHRAQLIITCMTPHAKCTFYGHDSRECFHFLSVSLIQPTRIEYTQTSVSASVCLCFSYAKWPSIERAVERFLKLKLRKLAFNDIILKMQMALVQRAAVSNQMHGLHYSGSSGKIRNASRITLLPGMAIELF